MQGAVVWRDSLIVHAAPVQAEDLGRPRSSRRPIAGAARPSAERGVSSLDFGLGKSRSGKFINSDPT